jgi:hypothetical protein
MCVVVVVHNTVIYYLFNNNNSTPHDKHKIRHRSITINQLVKRRLYCCLQDPLRWCVGWAGVFLPALLPLYDSSVGDVS